jgi:hypothetical protein
VQLHNYLPSGLKLKKNITFDYSKKRSVRFISGFIILSLVVVSGYSCRDKGDKNINQGEIHYSIEYMGSVGFMPKEVMPRNLVVSFKNNNILFDISAPFGNSGIMNLANPEKKIYDTYISLLTWRYFYSANPGEPPPGFDAMKGMVVRKTSKTSIICGFNCKNAEVILPGNKDKIYPIWYTTEINIKNPNSANPYREIDGVLMSFFFKMGTAEMHFTAETVYKKEIPDKLFERREKYMKVSRDEIDTFMNKMISF